MRKGAFKLTGFFFRKPNPSPLFSFQRDETAPAVPVQRYPPFRGKHTPQDRERGTRAGSCRPEAPLAPPPRDPLPGVQPPAQHQHGDRHRPQLSLAVGRKWMVCACASLLSGCPGSQAPPTRRLMRCCSLNGRLEAFESSRLLFFFLFLPQFLAESGRILYVLSLMKRYLHFWITHLRCTKSAVPTGWQ